MRIRTQLGLGHLWPLICLGCAPELDFQITQSAHQAHSETDAGAAADAAAAMPNDGPPPDGPLDDRSDGGGASCAATAHLLDCFASCEALLATVLLHDEFEDPQATAQFRALIGGATIEDGRLVLGPDEASGLDAQVAIHSTRQFGEVLACADIEVTLANSERQNEFAFGLRRFETGATMLIELSTAEMKLLTFEPEGNVIRQVESLAWMEGPQRLRILQYRGADFRYGEVKNLGTGQSIHLRAPHQDSAVDVTFESWELDFPVRVDAVQVGFPTEEALQRIEASD